MAPPFIELPLDAIVTAYLSGTPLREIAAFYGVGIPTVWRRLKAARVAMRRPGLPRRAYAKAA